MAWLAQIALFLMLGLLITPHALLRGWDVALALSLVLMLVARPIGVAICLVPFRFTWQEIFFIGWVGLRGAVPIYLATIPILVGVPDATTYLNLAFVAVLTSLTLQGWSVAWLARALGLELPPKPERPLRQELGLPGAGAELVLAAYRVEPEALAAHRSLARLILQRIRVSSWPFGMNGPCIPLNWIAWSRATRSLCSGRRRDAEALDRVFGARERPAADAGDVFGEFTLEGSAPLKALASLYGLPVPADAADVTLADYLVQRLGKHPVAGDRVPLGDVELVAHAVDHGVIRTVGIELEPEQRRSHQIDPRRIRDWLSQVGRSLAPR